LRNPRKNRLAPPCLRLIKEYPSLVSSLLCPPQKGTGRGEGVCHGLQPACDFTRRPEGSPKGLQYSSCQEPVRYYLAGSWAIYLCAAVGFFLGNVILPKDEVAKFPLSYIRTRLLYKLLLIFVFLIIILLETTTVATVNLNQISLQKSIKSNYLLLARSFSDKIDYVSASRGGLDRGPDC
jgi:hypothetical protein